MKTIYKILSLVFVLTVSVSCDRDQGDTDYLNNRDNIIYFDSTSGTLVIEDGQDNTYDIVVAAAALTNNNLSFDVSVDPASSAVEGVDFTVLGSSFAFNNGQLLATVTVSGDFAYASTEGKTAIFHLTSSDSEVGAKSTFTLDLFKFCPFDRDNFLGSYDADEEGYTVYPVTITAGAAANEIVISGVWDADPNSTTSVFLIEASETLEFPPYFDNYLYDHPTYGPAYIDLGNGTFVTCSRVIDMRFRVRVAAGYFGETHITFYPSN